MLAELTFAAIAVIAALFVARQWPDVARRVYRVYKGSRNLIIGIIGVATVLVFLGSGVGYLVIIGMFGAAVFALTVLYEEPHKQVMQWLP